MNFFKDKSIIKEETLWYQNGETDEPKPCISIITTGDEVLLTRDELKADLKYLNEM